MSKIVIIGGIESTYTNAQALADCDEEILMFYTRGENSKGWEGVKPIDDSKYPFAQNCPKTVVQGNINDYAKEISSLQPDYIWSLGWQQIFKPKILSICPCLGIHESLLPAGAGPVPIANAILHDVPVTGITLFEIDSGMDTGPIIGQLRGKLDPRSSTSTQLYQEAICLGKKIIKTHVPLLHEGIAARIPQDFSQRIQYGKITWDQWPQEKVARARTYPYI
ncbi:MAG: formyltransferase family protein [Bdellovibrionota bacterium]